MNTSIVIPLAANGFGSRYSNIELKYCLRSIEKHLSGYGDIFIIGHMPSWVRGCIHIPATDEDRTWWKERNIYRKILLACEDPRVTDDFLFMNDEHYLLSDFVAGEFPYYWDGFMYEQAGREDQYGGSARNTQEALIEGMGRRVGRNWDAHCPILYNKKAFNWLSNFNWGNKHGYCIKTLYCEYEFMQVVEDENSPVPGIRYPDLKINQPLPAEKIKELIAGRHWFSIGNKALDVGSGMAAVLEELYPNKSSYEK
jgi:hypothetical protein